MESRKHSPPKWATRFIEWYCRPELLEDLQGDLNEYFERNIKTKGLKKARLIYWLDAIKFCRPYLIKKTQPIEPMNTNIFRNYITTAIRNISKNKFFTAINIIGLAISMSVGLLLITFISELKSFDKFHKNYDRIYRVINSNRFLNDEAWFASTSIQAGKQLQEPIPGIEDVVILRNGFSNDVQFNDKTIPLGGKWASSSFFNIFSFDIIKGNADKALQEPFSVVLTESSSRKLFDDIDPIGKLVKIDTSAYTVTAVIKDPPTNSHFTFEILGSFSTIDIAKQNQNDPRWLKWNNMWINYVYILTAENCNLKNIQSRLDKISEDQNLTLNKESKIFMHLQPLSEVVISQNLNNNIGYNYDSSLIWILVGLAVVVILSACFNYTNLSIARAMRRVKEVGIRKVSGANTHQIFSQFIFEAVIVSIISLTFSFMLFLLIRPEFLSLDIEYQKTIKLTPGPEVFGWFIVLAIIVGLVAGFFPAIFFSKLNSAQILKSASSIRLFKHINIRKGLIIFQYTLTIMFVATVAIAYQQYKHAINFNLGFTTDNILNIKLLGNKAELVKKEFTELPEVSAISECAIIPSIGTLYADKAKYKDPMDSIDLYYNVIDENYIPLHQLKLIAGQNFKPTLASDAGESQIIVNEEALKRFNVGTPQEAIGEVFEVNGIKMSIIGVVQNFHYSIVADPIKSFAFRYNPAQIDFVNLKIKTSDITTLMGKIDAAWKKIDPVHPMEAKFFSTEIEEAYYDASGMIKIVGFLSVLSISIASLGLLGMVIFTTETRTKEIGIRKSMGASETGLLFLLSWGFIKILLISSAIALPISYLFFDQVLLADFAYRAPIGLLELLSGVLLVFGIAALAISSQTLRVARINPAKVLRTE